MLPIMATFFFFWHEIPCFPVSYTTDILFLLYKKSKENGREKPLILHISLLWLQFHLVVYKYDIPGTTPRTVETG